MGCGILDGMTFRKPRDFIRQLRSFNIDSEYLVVKPNWVSNVEGEFTEAEILDWVLLAFPKQEKLVVESYTPNRGLRFDRREEHYGQGVSLVGGKKFWDFYKKQDQYFLKTTGIGKVLAKHKADYINATNEFWSGQCVDPRVVEDIVRQKGKLLKWQELYSYVPNRLFEIREKATLLSLAKIKTEEGTPAIMVSMAVKNLFGLVPHPSRMVPFHGKNHASVPEVVKDVYILYTSLFDCALWVAEGIKTLVRNYCQPDQRVVKDQGLFFVGKNGVEVDAEACRVLGLDPKKVPYLSF